MAKPELSRILEALAALNDEELGRLVEARKAIAALEQERDDAQRRVEEINDRIASLAAGTVGAPRKPGRRPGRPVGSGRGPRGTGAAPKTGERLPELAVRILSEAGEPMRVKDLANAALKAGYVTRSGDFSRVVRILVYKDPRIIKADRGLFTVAGASPSAAGQGASKKGAKAAAGKGAARKGRKSSRKKRASRNKAGRAKA